MKVLSLFDGISCARVALERAGIPVEVYYASEIDKYAMQISAKNYPDIIQLGGVADVHLTYSYQEYGVGESPQHGVSYLGEIDLLIGGSPCQDLSIAKKDRRGLSGDRSGLFWEYVRILKEVKPKYFILENVASMPKEAKALITETLGVEPIMIDAALVSAQRRKRLFWTNIPNVSQPEDRGILLSDVVYFSDVPQNNPPEIKKWVARATVQAHAEQYSDKCPTLSASMGMGGGYEPLLMSEARAEELKGKYIDGEQRKIGMRKLTPVECEIMQSLPMEYTSGVSKTHRYKGLGNAFNVEVITHILSSL